MNRNLYLIWNYRSVITLLRQLLLTAILLLAAGCATSERDQSRTTFTTVVVDPGHGGQDSGANPRAGFPEKVWTLELGKKLSQNLTKAGFRVVMTRATDTFIPLDERVRISNQQRDAIFLSLHFNSTNRRAIHGLETYYTTNQSAALARVVHGKILEIRGLANRGILLAHFRVIRNNTRPAILIEGGYLTNTWESARISSAGYLDLMAQKISEGIVKYRGSPPASGASTPSTP